MKVNPPMVNKKTVTTVITSASNPIAADAVHTIAVEEEKRTLKPPSILGGRPPPDVHKEETDLPRNVRCTLSQLRAGNSSFTNHYLNRIDDSFPCSCCDCGNSPNPSFFLIPRPSLIVDSN